jgi:hypothetical protein
MPVHARPYLLLRQQTIEGLHGWVSKSLNELGQVCEVRGVSV